MSVTIVGTVGSPTKVVLMSFILFWWSSNEKCSTMINGVKLLFWSMEVAMCEEGNIVADSGEKK